MPDLTLAERLEAIQECLAEWSGEDNLMGIADRHATAALKLLAECQRAWRDTPTGPVRYRLVPEGRGAAS